MIRYIDSGNASGKPFLASVNFIANHTPLQAPDADIAAYAGRYTAGWTALRVHECWKRWSDVLLPAPRWWWQCTTPRIFPPWCSANWCCAVAGRMLVHMPWHTASSTAAAYFSPFK